MLQVRLGTKRALGPSSPTRAVIAAVKSLAKGAAVTAQGTDRVAGNDAYWLAVNVGGKTARVVGIDGPTRIALYETVKTGNFAGYRDTFNKMQSGISFSK